MAIVQSDLKYFLSEEVSSASTNGGAMSEDQAITGVKNNIWPNVSAEQRETGIDTLRKLFGSPRSDTDDELVTPKLWNHAPTPGDDYIYLFAGTKTDTEATADDTRKYGAGNLKTNVDVAEDTITVTVENAALTGIFAANDKVRLSNQLSPELTGDYEDRVIDGSAPTVNGLDVTFVVTVALTTAFLASNTVVTSMHLPGSSSASTGTATVTSASGTVDPTSYPPEVNNTGTKDEVVTFTFSTASNFSAAGSRSGALGSGTISGDFTATNPDNAKDLLIIRTGYFGGTYTGGDIVELPTVGNNSPFWLKRVVPALSGTLSGDENISAYYGESA